MANTNGTEVAKSIAAHLASKNVPPKQQWLQAFTPSIRLNTPLAALQKTALFRILASDLTASVQATPTSLLPNDIAKAEIKERRVRGPVTVQVLDVEDIGRSCWSQVEAIEAQERGETTKGREVIRVVPDENTTDSTAPASENKSSGPHKLLLQDAAGTKVYAIELTTVDGTGVQMSIGTKLVLKDVLVARGVILLESRSVEMLGGKVDAWDKKWREERKQALKEKANVRDGV